ncbi:aminotransferase class I/II-fold pyridoxal phosphate-dependent enzyme [Pseudoclavibacter sp. VKM Ac-2867]|uniref:aminotransferase class I/II-fold pyridoxal phosphate-dependent enzyme n=1 Tax=Pseudoclavibacter sp. VKM Ac-2867 TaxID=2783829 RepID=UPI001E28DE02|nr:aminotransferase class I/II-fold pyridoxal phosphate-dependent enzyme [Pseudoclavibacter sp. VKM Ac-2867]
MNTMTTQAPTEPLEMYAEWEDRGISPFFPVVEANRGNSVDISNIGTMLMFGSCDYLGLSQHDRLKRASIDAIAAFGTNTYGAQLLCGKTSLHNELQEHLQSLGPFEAALIFPSGMAANQAVVSSLAGPDSVIISDRTAHISLYMGSWLSKAELRTFPHNNVAKLEAILKKTQDKASRVILVDGLYSADGDVAPLPEIVKLAKTYDAITVVDEAHSFGTMGPDGLGVADEFGVLGDVDVIVGTMSKAIGSVGGFVLCSSEQQRRMRYLSPSFTSSRSVAPAVAAASLESLRILAEDGPRLRSDLARNTARVTQGLRSLGLDLIETTSHIVPIRLGNEQQTVEVSRWLMDEGVFTGTFVYPHVPLGEGRLRVGVTSAHSDDEIDLFLATMARATARFALN